MLSLNVDPLFLNDLVCSGTSQSSKSPIYFNGGAGVAYNSSSHITYL